MGSIRNRRKKLTTVLTDVDSRIRNVELRSISQQVADAGSVETDETFITPGSYLSSIAPSTWKRVIAGYYYPKRVTGFSNDRVELFLNVDSGLLVDEFLEVSGIRSPIDVSKKRVVLGVGQVVGDYRTDKPWFSEIPEGATHALLYSLGAQPEFNQSRVLKTKFEIESFSATTEVATIVFVEEHSFAINDVINVSDLGNPMSGIDGIFFVDTVPSTTSITYKFNKPIQNAIGNTPATPNNFVYATVHEYVDIGDSWINTATNPDSLFVWDGIRWIAASDPSSVKKDDLDPNPPSNLQVSSTAYPNETGFSRATATLSWDAPTQNIDGSELTDLAGYDVEWAGPTITGATGDKWAIAGGYAFVETSISIPNLPTGQEVQFRVRAIDTGGRKSTYESITQLMGVRSDVLLAPSAPIATTRLGTVTVRWDGLQAGGSVPPLFLNYLEVHVGTTSNFTPSTSTLEGKIDKTGNDFFVITSLPYNAVRFIRLVAVDQDGKKSPPSTQVQITVTPLVSTDIIGNILNGAQIVPNSITASSSIIGETITGGLIQALTITAGNLATNSVTADKVNAGAITAVKIATDAVTADKIQANAVTAVKINAGAITADKISANAVTADKIQANAITAVKIATDAVTAGKIQAGAVTADKISANAVTADKISAGAVTAVKISAGAVTADKIAANSITATNGKIESIDASTITAGTLTGRTIRTAASGKRVVVSNATNSVVFFDSNGIEVGRVEGDISSGGLLSLSGRGTAKLNIISSQSNFTGSVFSDNNIFATNRLGQQAFASLGVTTAAVHRSTSTTINVGLFGPSSSDLRVKKDIVELSNSLNLINSLRPVKFRFKSEGNGPVSYGLIAQEVQPLFDSNDNVVNSHPIEGAGEEYLSIEYISFIAPLIGAIKELTEINKNLEKRIENLESNL